MSDVSIPGGDPWPTDMVSNSLNEASHLEVLDLSTNREILSNTSQVVPLSFLSSRESLPSSINGPSRSSLFILHVGIVHPSPYHKIP